MTTTTEAPVRTKGRLLSTSLFIVSAAVLAQASFAGMFISGTAGWAREFHLWTGSVLPYFALVPAFSAWARARSGQVSGRIAALITTLTAAIWVQDVLGHMPFPVSTAVHVPLGVALFAGSLLLGVVARRAGA